MGGSGNAGIQVGENIRQARRAQQLTQAELAYRAGCSVRAVAALEKGEDTVTMTLFLDVCRALDCIPAQMLEGIE